MYALFYRKIPSISKAPTQTAVDNNQTSIFPARLESIYKEVYLLDIDYIHVSFSKEVCGRQW